MTLQPITDRNLAVDPNSETTNKFVMDLIRKHLPEPWRHEWGNAKKQAGVCRYRTHTIGLSAPIHRLGTLADLEQTVLHEVAHALAGGRAGHGPLWRATVTRIGGSAARCHALETPDAPWLGTCPNGHEAKLYKRPDPSMRCAACGREGKGRNLSFQWVHHGEPVDIDNDTADADPIIFTGHIWLGGLTGFVLRKCPKNWTVQLDEESRVKVRHRSTTSAARALAEGRPVAVPKMYIKLR